MAKNESAREYLDRIKQERREALRQREDGVLRAATEPGASAQTRAAAEQIRDHRAAGNYTTQG